MSIKEIMQINPANIYLHQHDALKEHVLGILKEVTKLIENEQYDKTAGYLFDSPAGDGHGCDNHCIDFGYDGKNTRDIDEIVSLLANLHTKAKL